MRWPFEWFRKGGQWIPWRISFDPRDGSLWERVTYDRAVNLQADGDRIEHEKDDDGYTKNVTVVRADGSREPVKFTSVRPESISQMMAREEKKCRK